MSRPIPLSWIVPDAVPADALARDLGEALGLTLGEAESVRRTYLDTFDWRLWSDGRVLIDEPSSGARRLRLTPADESLPLGLLQVDKAPRFVWDLPPGRLRRALGPTLEMRALLPRVRLASTIRRGAQRDDRGKTVLRVSLERLEVVDDDGGRARLGRRVTLHPVRGYRKPLKRAAKALKALELTPASGPLLEAALAAVGKVPGDYDSRIRVSVDADERADVATKRILSRVWEVLLANEEGVRADLDSEFLHDFRVAIRRTRSAVGQVKGVFPDAVVDRFKPRFRWLGRATGPLRDLDVYLLALPGFDAALPEGMRGSLGPLRTFLAQRQARAHAEVVALLDSDDYRRLKEDWTAFLEAGVPGEPQARHALTPVRQVAARRIDKAFRRVIRDGRAIGDDTPAEALHDLRKRCKKLRYLLELYRGALPDKPTRKLVRALKKLQRNLGDFQDFEVQAGHLAGFSAEMMAQDMAPAETMLALGVLVEHLRQGQVATRAAFADTFAAFDRPKTARRVRRLYPEGSA